MVALAQSRHLRLVALSYVILNIGSFTIITADFDLSNGVELSDFRSLRHLLSFLNLIGTILAALDFVCTLPPLLNLLPLPLLLLFPRPQSILELLSVHLSIRRDFRLHEYHDFPELIIKPGLPLGPQLGFAVRALLPEVEDVLVDAHFAEEVQAMLDHHGLIHCFLANSAFEF